MKKRLLTILACVLMLINVFAFSACGNRELEAKIAELEAKIEQQQEKLEELEEQISQSAISGTFYSLQSAYDNGLLTKDDLLSIAYYNNFSNWGNEEIMPEDFDPQPKNPEVLSETLDLKIRQACGKNTQNTADDYYIYGYFGVYNNCVVVKTMRKGFDIMTVGLEKKVDDVTFYYTGPFLRVYCMED